MSSIRMPLDTLTIKPAQADFLAQIRQITKLTESFITDLQTVDRKVLGQIQTHCQKLSSTFKEAQEKIRQIFPGDEDDGFKPPAAQTQKKRPHAKTPDKQELKDPLKGSLSSSRPDSTQKPPTNRRRHSELPPGPSSSSSSSARGGSSLLDSRGSRTGVGGSKDARSDGRSGGGGASRSSVGGSKDVRSHRPDEDEDDDDDDLDADEKGRRTSLSSSGQSRQSTTAAKEVKSRPPPSSSMEVERSTGMQQRPLSSSPHIREEKDGKQDKDDFDFVVVEDEEDAFLKFQRLEGTCVHCKKYFTETNKVLYPEVCDHRACRDCLRNHLLRLIKKQKACQEDLSCQATEGTAKCTKSIPVWMQKLVLSGSEFDQLEAATLKGFLSESTNVIFCPKPGCGECFEAVAAKLPASNGTGDVDDEGKPLSKEAREDRAKNRFRCSKCTTIFCRSCQAIPYHLGKTCEEWSSYTKAPHCRFCADALTDKNRAPRSGVRALESVCNKGECIEKRGQSCDKIHTCGHLCRGIKGEERCLECLHEDCAKEGVNEGELCNICYVEDFSAAPSVRLSCKHVFHYHCVKQKIEKKWPGARITFGFLNCPLCKVEISHLQLKTILEPFLRMKKTVQQKALERLKHEGLERDKRLLDKNDRYYKNPEAFSMDRFAYYPCFKCKKPYFGGMRRCEEAAQQDEEKFKPDELVCGSCAAGKEIQNCAIHKTDYIEYKCKFCCGIATWFCWGNTHFCESCHKKQEKGDYLNRKPRSALPKCPGAAKCPLGIEHPPNGEEFVLGCGICRPRVAAAEEI